MTVLGAVRLHGLLGCLMTGLVWGMGGEENLHIRIE